jgi:RraA family protein
MGTGFRIYTKINRPAKELVEAFRGLPAANVADEMNRFSCMDARIKPVNSAPLLGTAFTVKARSADNLLLHKAIDTAQPGDVIVVEAQGDTVNSLIGEIMLRQAIKRNIAGIIVDGAIRDIEALRQMNFPVYAAGCTPRGPYKDGPGEINAPISCGGVVIHPGDIIVGDADGVVVISPKDAPAVAKKAKGKFLEEQEKFRAIEAGTLDRSWVDKALAERGCEIIDDTWQGR